MKSPVSNERLAKIEEFLRLHRKGIKVLVFTDMVGSTQLKQDLGDWRATEITDQHHSLTRNILAGFPDATEVDTAGDSFFIVFGTASDAVKFAILMQSAVRKLAAEIHHPLADRIGIHAGEVIMEDREGSRKPLDLSGMQVDSSSRVMSLAQGDQILMTRFVFDNARQSLKGAELPDVGPLSWLNHGTYRMKGVSEPLEIFEVGEDGKAVLGRPGNSEKALRHVAPDEEPVLGWRPALGQLVPHTKWALEKKLGEGGFGEVWLGRHENLGQRRVFKFCFRAERVRSLKREVAFFRLLQERVGDHPNIVGIQDVFFDEPPYYIVMDYAKSEDLGKWGQSLGGLATVPLEMRLEVVAQTAEALQVAHDAGIIHRDVKPSNILVGGTEVRNIRVKLTDFGIGQMASKSTTGAPTPGFTQTMLGGFQGGSAMYLAPEILAGKAATSRSDVYSLGVVLYQVLVGDVDLPLTMDWITEISEPLLRDDLAKCLAGNPAKRFGDLRELAQQLRSLADRLRDRLKRETPLAPAPQAAPAFKPSPVTPAPAPAPAAASGSQKSRENSLGMKFTPVSGTAVWFSIWDTRVQDYQIFVAATGREWPKPSFAQAPTHPAVNVSWEDAQAFCAWLTEKERREGKLSSHESYRLPTDVEWSAGVGLAHEPGASPKDKDSRIPGVYPWGSQWPPPRGAGNYGPSLKVDDFDNTSPVGSFAANKFGLFDMGGNVWQWCEDEYDPGGPARVIRGASWYNAGQDNLLSSGRDGDPPGSRVGGIGFRVVLAGIIEWDSWESPWG